MELEKVKAEDLAVGDVLYHEGTLEKVTVTQATPLRGMMMISLKDSKQYQTFYWDLDYELVNLKREIK